jgi:putative polymerase
MSTVWDLPTDRADEAAYTRPLKGFVASTVVAAAVIFNFVLCFVDTNIFNVSYTIVISCEVMLIGAAFGLIWHRTPTLYVILSLLAAYFFSVMVIRSEFDPKILRDFLIPIAFLFLGTYLGSLRSADKLVTCLIILALGAALLESLALNTYLHFFDVIKYYVARGTEVNLGSDTADGIFIRGTNSAAGLFINGTRFGDRTLLPFLGGHRVSGIFLEPVSAGNFGVIAFAWILLRERRVWPFLFKTLAIVTIMVLADARFGVYLSAFLLVIYFAGQVIRPTILLLAPFVIMVALVAAYATGAETGADNSLAGRLMDAGHSIASLSPLQVFGMQTSASFVTGYAGDSGYGYALVKVGIVGLLGIWAVFVYAPVWNRDAWRFKIFVVFYTTSLLAISASVFSIKTAALVWFLYGTLNNPPDRLGSP